MPPYHYYLFGIDELIADPGDGDDVLRLGGSRLDFLTELIDEDAEVFGLVAVIGAPDGLQEFAMTS